MASRDGLDVASYHYEELHPEVEEAVLLRCSQPRFGSNDYLLGLRNQCETIGQCETIESGEVYFLPACFPLAFFPVLWRMVAWRSWRS